MYYKKLILSTLLILFTGVMAGAVFTSQAQAQDHSAKVEGKVIDSDDESLSGVEVTLRTASEGLEDALSSDDYTAITDNDGEFSIEGIEPGTYTLEVSQDGYSDSEQTVNLSEEETEEVEIQLHPVN